MKKQKPNPKSNKNILVITYALVGLFVCMLGYFGYFLQVQSENIINNSYNARLDSFSDRIVRGELLSRDGQVLARTEVAEDGTEVRRYPYDALFAHVVGYSDHGKVGLESLANFYLLSSHVNLVEKTVNELSDEKNLGDNVITTLDVGLQQVASDALGDRKGAVVVMEPDTGKILAMVSKPGYNPNTLGADWDSLISGDNTQAQLLNRATQGLYPPGSTFKIVTILEYMREHPDTWRDFTFDCDGQYEYEDYTISCYHGNAHGHQTLEQAFANSCNGAFSSLGLELNLGSMRTLTNQLLFNAQLPTALAYSKSSFVMGSDASAWEILQTSIGQGSTQMTPLHSCLVASAIANGGVLMKPYLIDHVETVAGEEIKKFLPESYGPLMNATEASQLSELMRLVVTDGTGSAVRTDAYTVAGKTGSAEFETGKETHAWFTGFAPAENPQLAVTVLVEEGGSGGQAAAPIARSIFDTWFSR
ncbi:MAG: penicillin-binding transpeptidase domain-containing protein [Lachnospiraceae bacterium]|nr:penicillin-binding transpeptidase domain-containing protein [Lachnospiraceae bacterium]